MSRSKTATKATETDSEFSEADEFSGNETLAKTKEETPKKASKKGAKKKASKKEVPKEKPKEKTKKEKPKKRMLTLIYVHDTPREQRNWEMLDGGELHICTVDPGTQNLAARVSRREGEEVRTLFLDNAAHKNLSKGDFYGLEIDVVQTYTNITTYLERNIAPYLDRLNLVIIEKQLSFNRDAEPVFWHILSWFISNLKNKPLLPDIFLVDAKIKGRVLGAGTLTKPQLKKWSVTKAEKDMKSQNDKEGLRLVTAAGVKKDDVCDVTVTEEAVFELAKRLHAGEKVDLYAKSVSETADKSQNGETIEKPKRGRKKITA